MPEIKTREIVKGTVKAIDKSAVAAQRIKRNTVCILRRVPRTNTPPTVFLAGLILPPVKPSGSSISKAVKV